MSYDPYGKPPDYLQAMANKRVFKKAVAPAKILAGGESIKDIRYSAIGMEKDSVVFCLALQDLAPDRLGGRAWTRHPGKSLSTSRSSGSCCAARSRR
jgi:hypothetical protein